MAESVVLTIAGSDCSGGAGLQADLKTFAAMGVYGCSVVTAITAQNYQTLSLVRPIQPRDLETQLNSVADAFDLAAVKLGMLGGNENADVVCQFLKQVDVPIVIDPVISATVGGELFKMALQEDQNPHALNLSAAAYYLRYLLPLATVLTPNLNEAAVLLGLEPAISHQQMELQVKKLAELGSKAVLLKGGHFDDDRLCTDYLAFASLHSSGAREVDSDNKVMTFAAARLKTVHGHGTGCTLASAIAAGLAQGLQIPQAVAAAKNYLQASLMAADRLGVAPRNGPLHHFSQFW